MEKAYKFRLYPNSGQITLLTKTFGCVRFVYNQTLAARKDAFAKKISLTGYDCVKMLPAMKKDFSWLKEVDSTALQSSVMNLDKAYQNFFRSLKKPGVKAGFPRFKSKRHSKNSYTTKVGIAVSDRAVKLPKLGWVKAKISTPVQGRILSATVSQSKSGKYFVSLCCTGIQVRPVPPTGAVVGLDVGIKDLLITSDGEKFPNPKFLSESQKKLAFLQRQLSRKTRGGSNYEKARIRVARQHEKISNQRSDYLHKITTELVRRYDVLCVESLNVSGMLKNHHLAKAIADASWGELVRQLKYKAEWHGKAISEIGTFYPSSQTCSACGFKNKAAKDLSVRDWRCPHCGVHHDRDVNAAQNILAEGLRILQTAS